MSENSGFILSEKLYWLCRNIWVLERNGNTLKSSMHQWIEKPEIPVVCTEAQKHQKKRSKKLLRIGIHKVKTYKTVYKLNIPTMIRLCNRKLDVKACLDSKSWGSFIDSAYVWIHNILTVPLWYKREIYIVDGSKSKTCTEEAIVLMDYKGHKEWIHLLICELTVPILLGYSWFKKHNLVIDQNAYTIKISDVVTPIRNDSGLSRKPHRSPSHRLGKSRLIHWRRSKNKYLLSSMTTQTCFMKSTWNSSNQQTLELHNRPKTWLPT